MIYNSEVKEANCKPYVFIDKTHMTHLNYALSISIFSVKLSKSN